MPDMREDYQKTSLTGLEIEMAVGIAPWEKTGGKTQRLVIDVDMYRMEGAFTGQSIDDCIDYSAVYDYVTQNWPSRPHTDLLETLLEELVAFCFRDTRIAACRVAIAKPHVFNGRAVPKVEFFRKRA
ncbi:MAG TPA: dihydroneopterin aldolase [Alphaproteobacteria bacterium]|nr:dihydroneopterin aldolase [Alphaproteobacteria bacterium]